MYSPEFKLKGSSEEFNNKVNNTFSECKNTINLNYSFDIESDEENILDLPIINNFQKEQELNGWTYYSLENISKCTEQENNLAALKLRNVIKNEKEEVDNSKIENVTIELKDLTIQAKQITNKKKITLLDKGCDNL